MTQSWKAKANDLVISQMLVKSCKISKILANVLSARKITDVDEAKRFLSPDINRDWSLPTNITGMSEACDVLHDAVKKDEQILIFGDFDVDGITATAIMKRGLSALGVKADYMIPNRINEGYGLTEAAVQKIIQKKPNLVVTVDCGISAKAEVDELSRHGIKVVVTDHHEPSDNVPSGIPVANPKLNADSNEHILAGAGVALKMISLLGQRMNKPNLHLELIDLVALGTVADMMPLLGENRSLVAHGLYKIQNHSRPGIAALAALSKKPDALIKSKDLSFTLIPRLNAAGRMGDPDLALQLLVDDDPVSAHENASALDKVNSQRKAAENELLTEAIKQADADYHGQKIIVVSGADWHEGVKGIIATRLVKKYGVPAIVFSIVDGQARASGRSVGGINLFKAVESCSDILIRFGGHDAAVGVTLKEELLPEFKSRIEKLMESIADEDFKPAIEVDCVINLNDINVEAIEELDKLEPFGQSNQEPCFASRGVFMQNARAVGANKNHLSFSVTDGTKTIQAIWFQCPNVDDFLQYNGPLDVIYNLIIDEWNGSKRVKLSVINAFILNSSSNGQGMQDKSLVINGSHTKTEVEQFTQEEELAEKLIGEKVTLHQAQKQALIDLDKGLSVLSIMATGRGKSLVFQIHSARLALKNKSASVFVYPLRALISDQCRTINAGFSKLGLCAKALTGEISSQQKDAVFSDLYEGKVDVILTTPEFFQLHSWRFAGSNRIHFIVFDEAHHLATEKLANRKAYCLTSKLQQLFREAQYLAVTATANDQICKTICQTLRIDKVIIDEYRRKNLDINDVRNANDRDSFLIDVVNDRNKSVVYVNSRASAVNLVRDIRKAQSKSKISEDVASCVTFYHAGLEKAIRKEIENDFKNGIIQTLVSTSAFGEGINIPDIRNVILFHLPFNLIAFNQMAGRAGRDGANSKVHLMFQKSDVQSNRKILNTNCPSRQDLITVYRALISYLKDNSLGQDFVLKNNYITTLGKICNEIDKQMQPDTDFIYNALMIFEELELISVDEIGDEFKIDRCNNQNKVELKSSIRYAEAIEELQLFEQFKDWAFTTSVDTMREYIVSPITPTATMSRTKGVLQTVGHNA